MEVESYLAREPLTCAEEQEEEEEEDNDDDDKLDSIIRADNDYCRLAFAFAKRSLLSAATAASSSSSSCRTPPPTPIRGRKFAPKTNR